MRQFCTVQQLTERGLSRAAIRWGEGRRWRRVARGVYALGPGDPTLLEQAVGAVLATGGVASGTLAATLLGLDGVSFTHPDVIVSSTRSNRRSGTRRRLAIPKDIVCVDGIPCTNALETLVDLADELDDLCWEQALESALRRKKVTIEDVKRAATGRRRGVTRIRRVLALRPEDASPTESLLETLMVQLARTVPGLGPPVRQYEVFNAHGEFVARVDLAWPELGLFIELDGQQHRDQPVYDASRQTAIIAATGWLCGRFTWHEVVDLPRVTARRLAALVDQARRGPHSLARLSSA